MGNEIFLIWFLGTPATNLLMSNPVLQKLLRVAASECYVLFTPEQTQQYHHELSHFLEGNEKSLPKSQLLDLYEMLLVLSLVVGQDVQARMTLDKIRDRFNSDSLFLQRFKLLHLMCVEVKGDKLGAIQILGQDRDEVRLSRRLTTFSRDKGTPAFISALNKYLDIQPGDLVAWAELGDAYHTEGQYLAAVFAYQEILLRDKRAYPIYYNVGLNYYYAFLAAYALGPHEKRDQILELLTLLLSARDNFLRSVELCSVYAQSWLGIYRCATHPINGKMDAFVDKNEVVKKWTSECSKLVPLSISKFRESSGRDIVDETVEVILKSC